MIRNWKRETKYWILFCNRPDMAAAANNIIIMRIGKRLIGHSELRRYLGPLPPCNSQLEPFDFGLA
jgi:hypothetical protein